VLPVRRFSLSCAESVAKSLRNSVKRVAIGFVLGEEQEHLNYFLLLS
jgi:hypothetical protein